jgi:hypothetical protein
MNRFPLLVWPVLALALLLLLMGLGHWEWQDILLGTLGAVSVFAAALYLATRGHDEEGRPRPRRMGFALGAIAAFYVVCAAAGAVAGSTYAVIAVLAGLVPAAAALLLIATMRSKSAAGSHGTHDATRATSDDGAPGIGMDHETPLGDTSEHSDAERVAEPDRRFERRSDVAR